VVKKQYFDWLLFVKRTSRKFKTRNGYCFGKLAFTVFLDTSNFCFLNTINKESQNPESQNPESQNPESQNPESQNPESQNPRIKESSIPESKNPVSQNQRIQYPRISESRISESRISESQNQRIQYPRIKESSIPESKNLQNIRIKESKESPESTKNLLSINIFKILL
jgi:hypothetical protein